ncbi:bifunctional riboflavin kinase/FAD synthetase [Oerskovia turbata]|uniref:Riboflavin biosynthesis protein n=1 Tax=Oerskovia turbata TaxID=1713 RepID=A0A4Q1KZ57_9CELL|nr:bifunctional riboflavin kinase/FAD synthetase [Oerskovia turbata]RXR27871.1 bifunctional riboflavin kinase/FAD synthetase [Oerskovia turbata]RXR35691.1 bifunctional riboflavin kinase/FAD synthetase [Oerskovia turbata]TGJ96667.1 bifunctional riboflavin kinase/FAD synthetase [Actinotalea fermentans ATCC 43279 = JCM 9966 = DSM 3133]
MHLWTDLDQVPPGFGPSVVTIGNFDGVHRGHAEVLGSIVSLARESGSQAVAVTFHPHPAMVHRPEQAPELLTGIADRMELLEATGLDAVLLVEYTLDFARQSPEEFVRTYLVEGLGARTVVVGHDVRFGRDNAGNLDTMIELGRTYGFEVRAIDDVGTVTSVAVDTGTPSGRWSSTEIRGLLTDGKVREAAALLGRHHRVRGVVIHGDARGRELGFPTANLGAISGMVPADGVYAGWLRRPQLLAADPGNCDGVLPAAISIGTNPTFDGVERRVEAYVLDRTDLDLYDEEVVLEFVEHLRPTLRFDGIEALVETMHDDVACARVILASGAGSAGPGPDVSPAAAGE